MIPIRHEGPPIRKANVSLGVPLCIKSFHKIGANSLKPEKKIVLLDG